MEKSSIDITELKSILGNSFRVEKSDNYLLLHRTVDTVLISRNKESVELLLFDDNTYAIDHYDNEADCFSENLQHLDTIEEVHSYVLTTL